MPHFALSDQDQHLYQALMRFEQATAHGRAIDSNLRYWTEVSAALARHGAAQAALLGRDKPPLFAGRKARASYKQLEIETKAAGGALADAVALRDGATAIDPVLAKERLTESEYAKAAFSQQYSTAAFELKTALRAEYPQWLARIAPLPEPKHQLMGSPEWYPQLVPVALKLLGKRASIGSVGDVLFDEQSMERMDYETMSRQLQFVGDVAKEIKVKGLADHAPDAWAFFGDLNWRSLIDPMRAARIAASFRSLPEDVAEPLTALAGLREEGSALRAGGLKGYSNQFRSDLLYRAERQVMEQLIDLGTQHPYLARLHRHTNFRGIDAPPILFDVMRMRCEAGVTDEDYMLGDRIVGGRSVIEGVKRIEAYNRNLLPICYSPKAVEQAAQAKQMALEGGHFAGVTRSIEF